MHKISLQKPDGRALHLYARNPIADTIQPTNPPHENQPPTPHQRWHPLRREWVVYASHRQNRTFLPPKNYSPLAVTTSAAAPTEMPAGEYEVAVFENLFPSLSLYSTTAPAFSVPTGPATGVCEVVVFTKDADASLGSLSLDRIELILEVLAERTQELGRNKKILYVLPFENRGVEQGVTLHHPHGQLYAYSEVPPIPAQFLASMQAHWEEQIGNHKIGLLESMITAELEDGRRILVEEKNALAFIPVCARYPYETWIAPRRPIAFLHELQAEERKDLARTLKQTLLKFDRLWQKPFPYLLTLFQAPLDDRAHPEAHLHFQIYPPLRTADRLKYLAGTELGGGVYINDSLPEEKAAELRAIQINPEELR
jgi:UDPglucose--hexose-1-phosphate uridylyltransferase